MRVVRLVGANGKGSTGLALACGAERRKVQTLLFASPWVCHRREAFLLGARPVAPELLARADAAVDEGAGVAALSVFERDLLVACWLARSTGVDLLLLEAGFGGPLDAVALWPDELRVFCSLEVEHAWLLGETEQEVAASELADLRPGTPVVCGPGGALSILLAAIRQVGGAPVVAASGPPTSPRWVGENQSRAAAALRVLFGPIGVSSGTDGGAGEPPWRWPGRFQRVGRWVLDGAHTERAMEALVEAVGPASPERCWLFGCFADKSAAAMVAQIQSRGEELHLLELVHPRALRGAALAALAPEATRWALSELPRFVHTFHRREVVVCGSFQVVAAALAALPDGAAPETGARCD